MKKLFNALLTSIFAAFLLIVPAQAATADFSWTPSTSEGVVSQELLITKNPGVNEQVEVRDLIPSISSYNSGASGINLDQGDSVKFQIKTLKPFTEALSEESDLVTFSEVPPEPAQNLMIQIVD